MEASAIRRGENGGVRPCKNGHADGRYGNGKCKGCHREAMRRCKEKDPERHKAALRRARTKYREANPGREYELFKATLSDPEKRAAYRSKYNEWHRRNHQKDPVKKYALNAERRGRRGRATPAWLTPEQRAEMRDIYRRARRLGDGWHVDHIVPLNGRNVSGLHVPWNLQIVPADQNLKKSNLLPADA